MSFRRRHDITDDCKADARRRLLDYLEGVKVWDTPFRDAAEVLRDWVQESADNAFISAAYCPHDRLNEDGICRKCGADCRGIASGSAVRAEREGT